MKHYFIAVLLITALFSCSKDNHFNTEKPIPLPNKPDLGIPGHTIIQQHNLKPSMIDSINFISTFVEYNNYRLLIGQRNYKGWIANFDKAGNELFSFEMEPETDWKYSHYDQYSIRGDYTQKPTIYGNVMIARGWCTNEKDRDNLPIHDIQTVVYTIDLEKGQIIEKTSSVKHNSSSYETLHIKESNNRLLIELEFGANKKENKYIMMNDNGQSLWKRKKKETEDSLYEKEGFCIWDDERLSYSMYSYSQEVKRIEYNVLNMKDYKLLHKYYSSDIKPMGDRIGDENISYYMDTVYFKDNKVRFVYTEEVIEKDEITNQTIRLGKVLDKYYYEINPDDYNLEYKGKIN